MVLVIQRSQDGKVKKDHYQGGQTEERELECAFGAIVNYLFNCLMNVPVLLQAGSTTGTIMLIYPKMTLQLPSVGQLNKY